MNKIIKILLFSDAFMLLSAGMFGPLYAAFVSEIGGSLETAGWAFATFAITSGIFTLAISRAEDKMKKEEIMIPLGYFIYAIGVLGYLFIDSQRGLFIVQMILGLGIGIKKPAWDGIYSENLDEGQYTTEWGYETAQTEIFTAIAAGFGGFIAATYDFRALFLIMFIFAICSFFASLRLIRTSLD